jgi:hypothetical protein
MGAASDADVVSARRAEVVASCAGDSCALSKRKAVTPGREAACTASRFSSAYWDQCIVGGGLLRCCVGTAGEWHKKGKNCIVTAKMIFSPQSVGS